MTNKIKRWESLSDQKELKKSLLNNAVSITTTDTVLGLLAPITEGGLLGLNDIKGGRENKPYVILIGNPKNLELFVSIEKLTPTMKNIIARCWPGQLTIIFKTKPGVSFYLKSSQETIAIRCPNHKGLLVLLEGFDGLFSTSANESGQPIPKSIKDIPVKLIEKVASIVTDQHEDAEMHQPSTIIDFSEAMDNPKAPIRVIREGIYPIKDLEKHYGSPFKK